MTGAEMEPGMETGGGTMAHLAKLFDMARDRSPGGTARIWPTRSATSTLPGTTCRSANAILSSISSGR